MELRCKIVFYGTNRQGVCDFLLVIILIHCVQTTSPTLRRAIFRCKLCLRFNLLAECEALNFVDGGRRSRTAWTTTPPLSVDIAGHVNFLN